MHDPTLISVIALQAVLALAGIVVLPWGGARLDAAALSLRALRRRLRELAVTATGAASDPQRRARRSAARPGASEGSADRGSRTTDSDRIERRIRGLHALGAVSHGATRLAPAVAVCGSLRQRVAS